MIVSPGPAPRHMIVMVGLIVQLTRQLPADLQIIPGVDIDLRFRLACCRALGLSLLDEGIG
jgi:hypothetical protein